VEDFPAIVVNDIHGGDLYQIGVEEYREEDGGKARHVRKTFTG